MKVFENKLIYIELEESEIPWFKIFSQREYKEFSECDKDTKIEILRVLDVIEKEMIKFYKPQKINIASFGNYLPYLHFHIMARFKDDSYFPECMWGEKQRESKLDLPPIEEFVQMICKIL